MELYFYSPSGNKFLAASMLEEYKKSGTWPTDAFEISESIYQEFGASPAPYGKIMVAGVDGFPEWGDQPSPEGDELIEITESKKNSLLNHASKEIDILQDAADLNMATEDEQELLLKWKKYRVILSRIDTSDPENIIWPEVPGNVA